MPAVAIPADVKGFVARRFEAADRAAVLELIESATIHDGSAAGARLIRCALVASAGSMEKLRVQVEHLRIDYRDVIVAGEYIVKGGRLVRIRNLNKPIDDEG